MQKLISTKVYRRKRQKNKRIKRNNKNNRPI